MTRFSANTLYDILYTDVHIIKNTIIEYYAIEDSRVCEIPSIDDILQKDFLFTKDIIEILRLFISIGSVVENYHDVLRILFRKDKHNVIDYLIYEGLCSNEQIFDYYTDDYNSYVIHTHFSMYDDSSLLSVFNRYDFIRPNIQYKPESNMCKLIQILIEYNRISIIQHFHSRGIRMKHFHFKRVKSVDLILHIIANYHPNKYCKWIKSFLYTIDCDQWRGNTEFKDIKYVQEWRWFFAYFRTLLLRKFHRFRYVTQLSNLMDEYSRKQVQTISDIMYIFIPISDDVIDYCIVPFMC